MILLNTIYLAIKKRLSQDENIKTITYANNGTDFSSPLVHITFEKMDFGSVLQKMQTVQVEFTLEILTENFRNIDDAFEQHCLLIQSVSRLLHGFSCSKNFVNEDNDKTVLLNSVKRQAFRPPARIHQYIESYLRFEAIAYDNTLMNTYQSVVPAYILKKI